MAMYFFTKLTQVIKATVVAVVVASAVFVVPGSTVHASTAYDPTGPGGYSDICSQTPILGYQTASGITKGSPSGTIKSSSHYVLRLGTSLMLQPSSPLNEDSDSDVNLQKLTFSNQDPSVLSVNLTNGDESLALTPIKEGTTTITYTGVRAGCSSAGNPITITVTVLPTTCYSIQSRLNNYVMDVAKAQMQEGQRIVSYPWHGNQNQLWNMDAQGHLLSNQNINYGLAVMGQNTPAVLTQNLTANNRYAQWGGPYAGYLRNIGDNLIVLSVQGSNAASSTPIVGAPQIMGMAQTSQAWILVQATSAQCAIEPAQ